MEKHSTVRHLTTKREFEEFADYSKEEQKLEHLVRHNIRAADYTVLWPLAE